MKRLIVLIGLVLAISSTTQAMTTGEEVLAYTIATNVMRENDFNLQDRALTVLAVSVAKEVLDEAQGKGFNSKQIGERMTSVLIEELLHVSVKF